MEVGLEHLPLAGYFAIIAGLLAVLLQSQQSQPAATRRASPTSSLFGLLALVSLAFTWTYMFKYFAWSRAAAATRAGLAFVSTKQWLRTTYLFEEAWSKVSDTPEAWWWSEQLCAWTAGPLTILFAVEGKLRRACKRRGIKHLWAYMLLGQVVAISVAQNLFFAALSLAPRSKRPVTANTPDDLAGPARTSDTHASWTLILSVLTSLFTVGVSPRVISTPYFLPNLLLMHVLLILPLVPLPTRISSLSLGRLYTYTAIIPLRLRLPTYTTLLAGRELSPEGLRAWLPEMFNTAYTTLFAHPAQSSIGYDVLFASLSFIVWMALENHRMGENKVGWVWVAGLASMTPLVGVAVSGGLYLGAREVELERVREAAGPAVAVERKVQ